MQCFDMPTDRVHRLLDEMKADERRAVVHHEHLANGRTRLKTVVTGQRIADVHAALDKAQAAAEAHGASNFHRTKIGRNVSCPCGSGLKFKKCCIDKAAMAG